MPSRASMSSELPEMFQSPAYFPSGPPPQLRHGSERPLSAGWLSTSHQTIFRQSLRVQGFAGVPAMPVSLPRPRRVPLACTSCRIRKSRVCVVAVCRLWAEKLTVKQCNGDRPTCSNCVVLVCDCRYEEAPRNKRARRGSNDVYLIPTAC